MADVEYKFIDNTVLADEVIGHANISSISDGTLRGAVKKINTDLDGVKEHLQEVDSSLTTNILKTTLSSMVSDGITITYNEKDGTYTINGTCTKSSSDYLLIRVLGISNNIYVGKKLVGKQPNGEVKFFAEMRDSDNAWKKQLNDNGNGVIIENYAKLNICVAIKGGTTVNNEIIKPMITSNVNAQYSDYVPYTGSTGKLTSDVAELQSTVNSSLQTLNDVTQENITNVITNKGSSSNMTVIKNGKVIHLYFHISDMTLNSGSETVAQIPEKYRPVITQIHSIHGRNLGVWADATYYPVTLSLNTSGELQIRTGTNYSNIKYLSGNITYITNN